MKLSEEMLYEHARKAEELWLNSLPSDDKIPEHRFSNKFERKMRKLIRSQRRSPGLNQFLSASKRIAVKRPIERSLLKLSPKYLRN